MRVQAQTKILGVFGHPVSHSLSPIIQNAAIEALGIDYVYVAFHVMPEDLAKAVDGVRSMNFAGVNLTIPHKERVIDFLDEISENARRIGSVNTIVNKDGYLVGESTDGVGFLRSAEAAWGKLGGGRAVILGAGGSAKAIAFALGDAGFEVIIANRTLERAEELAENLNDDFGKGRAGSVGMCKDALGADIARADLLVNTTSVGMKPDLDGIPLPPEMIHAGLRVYDIVYDPRETRLVREAKSRGARALNGLGMLIHQGAMSLEMWTGQKAPVDVMEKALREL